MKRVLCLWLPNWPIQRLGQEIIRHQFTANPKIETAPDARRSFIDSLHIILYSQQPRRGKRVQFCSHAAWEHGIRADMTVAEATTILRKTRNAARSTARHTAQDAMRIHEYDRDADRVALEEIASGCHQYSPLVGLETNEDGLEPSSLLMDLTGSAPRLGGEHAVAQSIAGHIQQLGYDPRIGVAHTIGAAWAFARTTDNIKIVPIEDVTTELETLPIETLRLPAKTGDLLTQLGVRHVGELLQLPRESLQARFGPELLFRIDQTTGRVSEAIVAHSPAPPLVVTRTLEHPISRRKAIEHMTRDLVDQLCERLVEQDQEAIQLQYALHLASITHSATSSTEISAPEKPTEITVGLYQPNANPQHIFDLLNMQLESTVTKHPIQQATLTATIVVPRADEQHNLFDTQSSPAPRQLAHLIERLSSRLGTDRVVAAHLSREPQVEMAFRYRSLAGKRPRAQSAEQNQKPLSYTRPLLLIHPPIPLQITGLRTSSSNQVGPPESFSYRNHSHRTIAHWGPERIETGWWRGPTVRRDYYRVEDEHGSRFWLFHDLRHRRWFLHGEFG